MDEELQTTELTEVTSTDLEVIEGEDNKIGAAEVGLIALAAVGTYQVGKWAFKGFKKLKNVIVQKNNEKIVDEEFLNSEEETEDFKED